MLLHSIILIFQKEKGLEEDKVSKSVSGIDNG